MKNILEPNYIIETREEWLNNIPKNLVMAELGVFKGDFSKILLTKTTPKKLYLVDIFTGYAGSGDKDGSNFEMVNLDVVYHNILDLYANNNQVEIIKNSTSGFMNSIADNYLDMVYIDADHSYEAVSVDLEYSWRKVRNKGIISGHDFCNIRFPGTVKAVIEFCKKYNQVIDTITRDGCPTFSIIKTT